MRSTFRNNNVSALVAGAATAAVLASGAVLAGASDERHGRTPLPEGAIEHILVINLENENFSATFGPGSPAVYLNSTLLSEGQLLVNYFATSHVSLGNYISQISGQAPTPAINNDCINLATLAAPPLLGGFTDIVPGLDAEDQVRFPGQVVGDGCVFPAPASWMHGARTIGDQLDAVYGRGRDDREGARARLTWRAYAEDMGNDQVRDYGAPDPLGGTDCAHAPVGGIDFTNSAAAHDRYATRHNPFVYFHSVIDNPKRCNDHVVPLGRLTVGSGGARDTFQGHLAEDLRRVDTTPRFMFVTPNLCNDAHDAVCVGPNVEGTTNASGQNVGGLVAADLWLKHWMPMILNSPAYRSGTMLVVLTFDESGFTDSRACPAVNQADCKSPTGPNVSNPGFSPILGLFHLQTPPTANYVYAGGGQVGAVLFNARYIEPGSINTAGSYNHYSALRSYEDLLGIHEGGDDGRGHLGYASVRDLNTFGVDVFNGRAEQRRPWREFTER